MTNETTNIPLNNLVPWEGNVRRTGASDGIDELAASIAGHGLLQSLVVRESKHGKFEIVAGRRRYLALKALVKKRKIKKDHPVPCQLADESVDASELSLAENVVRMPMHPADQFEAFRNLIDGGASTADVAARFGVSETLVAKRLKLGRVSPVILEAYRNAEISLELVQAFTVSDDHEAQERVFQDLPPWNVSPVTIKRALTEGEVPATDKRVKLVGLDAYEAAGGAVRRDLFDPDDGGYILDPALLDNLVTKTLEQAADQIRAEGWQWVEIRPELDYGELQGFDRRYPEDVPLSKKKQAELDKLTAEYDELVDTDDDAEIKRLAEIERRIDELNAASQHWPDETLAMAGAIISLGYHGDIRVERGLVQPEDSPLDTAEPDSESASTDNVTADEPAIKLSARLTEDLTAQKSAAISAELAKRPDIALATVAHALALAVFYNYGRSESCLQISGTATYLRGALYNADECSGLKALEVAHGRFVDCLPGDPADLWLWCLDQPQDVLLDLLAVIAAHTVDAMQVKSMRPDSAELRHANALAQAVSLNVADYFSPTAENLFTRISSAGIQAALCEAKKTDPAPGWAKLKKAELAALAEREIAETGWLPASLRIGNETELETQAPLAEAAE